MTRGSRTYTILGVPATVYAAIRAILVRGGEHRLIHSDGPPETEVIDLSGIALKSIGAVGSEITIGTILSSRTKTARIDFTLNGELTQWDLDKAREILEMLQTAIEAAISDELIYKFLRDRLGLTDAEASAGMVAFRELRQGSAGTVYPS